jgi:hypothetical protein
MVFDFSKTHKIKECLANRRNTHFVKFKVHRGYKLPFSLRETKLYKISCIEIVRFLAY